MSKNFNNQKQKSVLLEKDPISKELWYWADFSENFGKIGAVIIGLLTIIILIFVATNSEQFIFALAGIILGPIFGVLFYLTIHGYVVLLSAFASIVYNTSVTANLDAYNTFDREYEDKTTTEINSENKNYNRANNNVKTCENCGQKNAKTRTTCLKCGFSFEEKNKEKEAKNKFTQNSNKFVTPTYDKTNNTYNCPKCGCKVEYGQFECICTYQMNWENFKN